MYRSRAKQTTLVKKSPKKSTIKRSGIKYDVHDNGGRPFRVYINGNKVDIYKNTSKEYNGYDYSTLTKSFKADKIFIGSAPKSQKGNSILLKIGKKYIYIGTSVKEFKPKAEIVKYVSPVGNSDVPYPYAIDINGNYYLMIENVILDHIEGNEPYDYYYNERPKKVKLVSKTLIKGY